MVIRTYLLLLSILLGYSKLYAQTDMTVALLDGDEYVNELSTETCITFLNDSIMIGSRMEDNMDLLLPIANVRKLCFTENTVSGVVVVEDCSILIYPNPVRDYFAIKGIQGKNSLSIYSITGAEMLRTQYKTGEYVDVSWLKPGSYIIRVGKCVEKFTKK